MVEIDQLSETYGAWLFAQECTFLLGAPTLKHLPAYTMPEIAFIGRSNVGKSSLINALTNRNTLARTSNTPGRTQHLNFFDLGSRLILVDMPGYGYAKAPKSMVASWQKLIRGYLTGRPTLQRVYVLIDSRHGLKENDFDMMQLLDKSAVSYQLVVTKIDKISLSELQQLQDIMPGQCAKNPACHPRIVWTSSEKKQGIETLRAEIAYFAPNLTPVPEA